MSFVLDAGNNLVLIELTRQRVDLINDMNRFNFRMRANENINMIVIGADGSTDVTVVCCEC